jgi:peptide deformylase
MEILSAANRTQQCADAYEESLLRLKPPNSRPRYSFSKPIAMLVSRRLLSLFASTVRRTAPATLAVQGVGLAAPQIAVPLRLFVIEDTEERMTHLTPEQRGDRHRHPYPFEAILNPTWRATSPRTVIEQEGCLSIPAFKADVPRYWAIEVEGFLPDGERKRWSVEGWPARFPT